MAPRLSQAERAVAEEIGQTMFRYDSAAEKHGAVLRRDPEGYAAAYREYALLKPPPLGHMPPADDLERCVRESEIMLAKDCQTPYEFVGFYFPRVIIFDCNWLYFSHLVAASATMFLSHVKIRETSTNQPERVILASMSHATKLRYVVGLYSHRRLCFTKQCSKETPYEVDPQTLPRAIPSVILDLMPLDPNRMTASGHIGLSPRT